MYVSFDPKQHEGEQLLELQSVEVGDTIATVAVPSATPFGIAEQTPWHYVVEMDEDDAD